MMNSVKFFLDYCLSFTRYGSWKHVPLRSCRRRRLSRSIGNVALAHSIDYEDLGFSRIYSVITYIKSHVVLPGSLDFRSSPQQFPSWSLVAYSLEIASLLAFPMSFGNYQHFLFFHFIISKRHAICNDGTVAVCRFFVISAYQYWISSALRPKWR